ncbi:high affinity immunoglobulin epsilon receptor subunit beta-like [Pempheris klunzingeri]|uniref:high affinity immunoglobulin epsilon receptor subunit beta-like n=1 Tax=Pempheris klunzingeri TaxID=3127111 RepID=UPI003980ACB9
MASTSIATVGGVVVVTQVIPKDHRSIPLQAAASGPRAPPPARDASPAKMDDMTATFLRGEPQGLGVVQIFIGLLCVLFSLSSLRSDFLLVSAPFCLAVTFVVSGSLSVAAARRTTIGLVVASLVWNLISVVVGEVGVAYVCWLLVGPPPSERFCGTGTLKVQETTERPTTSCFRYTWMMDRPVYGLLGLLLVLLLLQICVALTVCIFSGKAIRRRPRAYVPLTVEDGRSPLCSPESERDSDGEGTTASSPNSP